MKHFKLRVLIVSLCVGIYSASMDAGDALCQSCEQGGGKIVSVQGVVQVQKAGETKWQQVGLNDTYCTGDTIRVLKNSRAAIVLSNETLFRLDQNTTISFTGVEKEKTFLIDLIKGMAHFFSRFPRRLKVKTPFLNAAVEGTEFYVRVDQDQTFLSIFEGRVAASNEAGSLVLTGGQSAAAGAAQAPALRVVVKPRDAVQWALYYPAIIDWQSGDFPGGQKTDWQAMVRQSIVYYWKGDLAGAFSALAKAPDGIRDPHFYSYRAALLLSVGRIEAAQTDISRALDLETAGSYAMALQSIIAVVQNDKDQALALAAKAAATDPQSPTAMIAVSYAQQAHFDIQGALNSLRKAVNLGPDNALAWSRLAELYLSVGELAKASKAAQKAVSLNPNLAHTQTVLGFTYIDRIKIRDAEKVFNKAILLDSAAPLARLGLGLAMIRRGDLKEGRAEIEIAASLDPSNSILRSYLGKAYYDEKREEVAEDQYLMAKELDPKDPTPWFYDAIRKQTVNRPVEALQDMQKSIELNDNRAVYRSRLLLDEDLAARSASLGRIYNDLGFQQLGLVEGWKSVNTAPANYSAHRLLADLYAALPRHEIARVSELLQSQLLQPINITPVQPQLAESNLFILDGAGPSNPSFNEFNPLFLRNRFALQASGLVGGNDTWGNDLIQSTVWDKFSYSLGQFHYETDGFRENNDQKQDIYNIFAQLSLSPNSSAQAEYRHTDKEKGDLSLRFDPDLFFVTERTDEQTDSIRLGFHHAFNPNAHFIASFIYQDADFKTTDSDFGFEFTRDDEGYLGEIQQQYSTERFNIIGGVGHFTADRKDVNIFTPIPPETLNIDIDHTNVYGYASINYPENFTWTLGASGDFLDGAFEDTNQFNPKLGLIFRPFAGTTLRGAAFRTLQRTLISSLTIEPTQVAGFNQFFNDSEGVDAWRYGMAVDQKFSELLYGGIELSRRDLEVPFEDFPPPSFTSKVRKVDWEEQLLRAYLYWTPQPWMALSAEYQYEDLERDSEFVGDTLSTELKTHRLPLGLNFFHPSGLIARVKATYVYQEGEFGDPFVGVESEDDQFWVVDAAIGYRLPKRYGLVSLEVKNLFDEEFNFQDTDPANPRIIPERLVIGKITLSF